MTSYTCITTKKSQHSDYLIPIYIKIPDSIPSQEIYDLFIDYAKQRWEDNDEEQFDVEELLGNKSEFSVESYLWEKLGSSDVTQSCKDQITIILQDPTRFKEFQDYATHSADIRGCLD